MHTYSITVPFSGGVSALAFSFVGSFIDELKELGVDTSGGKHSPKFKLAVSQLDRSPQRMSPPVAVQANSAAKAPEPIV